MKVVQETSVVTGSRQSEEWKKRKEEIATRRRVAQENIIRRISDESEPISNRLLMELLELFEAFLAESIFESDWREIEFSAGMAAGFAGAGRYDLIGADAELMNHLASDWRELSQWILKRALETLKKKAPHTRRTFKLI